MTGTADEQVELDDQVLAGACDDLGQRIQSINSAVETPNARRYSEKTGR